MYPILRTLPPIKHSLFDSTLGDSMRRILVVNNGSILERGLTVLLSGKEGLDTVGIDFVDEGTLVAHIASNSPDVVIINQSTSINVPRFLHMLRMKPELNCVQVLTVRNDTSAIKVYSFGQTFEIPPATFYNFLQGVSVN